MLGEALGAQEASKGVPFVGDAGFQLNRTLQRTKFDRQDFLITNVCRCQPPNNWLEGAPWEHEAILHCDQYLLQTIERMKPKVILPMGNVALRSILGRRGIEKLRGYVYDVRIAGHSCHAVPTYHPSFILRGKDNLTGVNIFDIQRAVRTAADGYEEPEVTYVERPSQEDLSGFLAEAVSAAEQGLPCAADIETPTSGAVEEDEYGDIIDADIICISFSFRAHHALTVRWTNENFWFIEAMLALPWRWLVWWNKEFDVPRITSKGVQMTDHHLDAMEAWRWAQSDVPHGLGFAATFFTEVREWKSLSSQMPEFYSCKDSDVLLQCFKGIKALLEKEGRWDAFIEHVVEVDPLLKVMGRAGVPVDMEKRAEFRARLEGELDEIDREIQQAVPKSVRPFRVRKRVPADAVLGGSVEGKEGAVWDHNPEGEWGERHPFLYNSPKQLVCYMTLRGHPVPRHHKTKKDTTGKDDIEKLAKRYPKDPLYPLILEARKRKKLIGTYIDGQEPDADGRLRTNFTFKTTSNRLAAERPNVMNQPKRGELARIYRQQFVPEPGHVIVGLDFKGFQAGIIGWLAKDADFMKAAKLGVHAILASHVLARQGILKEPIGMEWGEWRTKEIINWIKEHHYSTYDDCKHAVFGSSFGGSPYKLKMDFPESFPTVKDAKELQDLYFSTIGRKVKQWQQETLNKANRQCYLETPFKARCYFWNIFAWDSRRNCYQWGPSAKDALAYEPQSIERCILTNVVKRLDKRGTLRYLRWLIHDAIEPCMVPIRGADDIIGVLREEAERPVPELDGSVFAVDVEWSDRSWADMQEWKPGIVH